MAGHRATSEGPSADADPDFPIIVIHETHDVVLMFIGSQQITDQEVPGAVRRHVN